MSSPDPDATDSSSDERDTAHRNGGGKKATVASATAAPADGPMEGMPALQSMAEVASGVAQPEIVMAQSLPSSAHLPLHKSHSTGMATLAVPITTATIIGGAAGSGRPPVSPQRAQVLRTPSPNSVGGGGGSVGRRSPSQSPMGVQPQRSPNASPLNGMSLGQGSRSTSPGVVTASIIEEGSGVSSSTAARPVVAMAVPVSAQQLGPQTQRSDNPQIVMASVSLPPPPRSHKKAPSIGASPQGSPTHRPVASGSNNGSSGSGNKKKSNHTAGGDQSDGSERAAAAPSNVFNEDVDALLQLAMFSTEADESALAPKKTGSAPVMNATAALLASDKKRKSKAIAEGTGPVVNQPVVASIIPSPAAASSASALHSGSAAAAHSNMLPSIKKQKLGLSMAKSVSGGTTPNLSPTLAAAVPTNGLKKEGSLALGVSPATIVQGQGGGIKKATKLEASPLKGPMLATALPTVMASAVYEGNGGGGMPMQMQQQPQQQQMQMHPQQYEMIGPNGPYLQQHPFDPMQMQGPYGAIDPRTGMPQHMQMGPYGGANGMMNAAQFNPAMGMQNFPQFAPFPPQQQQQQGPGQPGQPSMTQGGVGVGPNGQQFVMNGGGSVGSMQSNSLGPQQQLSSNGMFPGSFYAPNGQLMTAGPGGMMMGPGGGFMPSAPQQQMGPMGYGGGPLNHMQQMQMMQPHQQQIMGAFPQQQQPPHLMMHPAQPLMQMPMLGASLSPTNKRCARHVEIAYYIHLQKAQAQAAAAAAAQQAQTVPAVAAAATAVPSTDGVQPMTGVTTGAAPLSSTVAAEISPPQQNGTTAPVTVTTDASMTTTAAAPSTAAATATAPAAATTAMTAAATTDAVAPPTTSPALAPSTAPALSTATAPALSTTTAQSAAQPGTGSPPMLTGVPALAPQQQQMPPMQLQPGVGGLTPMQQMQMQQGMGPMGPMSMSVPMQMQPGFPDPTLEARRLKQQRDWMRQAPGGMGPQAFGVGVGMGGDLAYQQHLMNMQQGFPMQAGMPNGAMMLNGAGAPNGGVFPGSGMPGQMGPGGRFMPGLAPQQQLMQGMGGPGQFVAPGAGSWPPPQHQQPGGMQQQQQQPMMDYMAMQGGMQMHPSMAAMQQQFNPHMQQQPMQQHPSLMASLHPPQQQQLAPLSASIVPLPPMTGSALATSSSAATATVSAGGTSSTLASSPPAATAVATLADAPVAIALSLPLASPIAPVAPLDSVVAASALTAPAAAVAVAPATVAAPVTDAAPAAPLLPASMPLVGSA